MSSWKKIVKNPTQNPTHNMYEGSFWNDRKVLKLDHSGSCATLIY